MGERMFYRLTAFVKQWEFILHSVKRGFRLFCIHVAFILVGKFVMYNVV